MSQSQKVVDDLMKNTSDESKSRTVSIPQDVLEQLVVTNATMAAQLQRFGEYELNNYQFNLQHHENIKLIMKAINSLDTKYITRPGVTPYELEPIENKSLYREPHGQLSIHDQIVMHVKSRNMFEVENLMKGITDVSTFEQLKEESFEMVLQVFEKWLDEPNNLRLGLVLLYEGARVYPKVFAKQENQSVVNQACRVLETLSNEDIATLDLESEWIRELYQFMRHQQNRFVTP